MSDLLSALAERLAKVPRYCDYCATTEDAPGAACRPWDDAREHSWMPDDRALATVALAFVAGRLPTRDEVVDQIAGVLIPYLVAPEPATGTKEHLARFIARAQADALLRDLRLRLGEKA